MKRFIVLPRALSVGLLLGGLLVSGSPVFAQQAEKAETTVDVTEKDGKIKIVKVINGETTVEEYDASEMKGKMIWMEEGEEADGDVKVQKHVIHLDGENEGENIFEFRMDGEDGQHPRMIMIDEEVEESMDGDSGEHKNVFITKEVIGNGTPGGKMKVHTIKVVNGDTVLNSMTEEDESMIMEHLDKDKQGGAHVIIMHDDDDENVEKNVNVKVISDGDKEYKYEMIIVRTCKSVKMEEPASAELEKLGELGQANSLEVKKLEAFPSPNEGRFTVRFQLKDKTTPATMGIFNLEGQEVYQEKFSGSKNYEKQIDLGDVPAGVYLLRITQGEESMTRKLVVE
jgi:translation initiation factor IF-1